jgi:hypothetical protein
VTQVVSGRRRGGARLRRTVLPAVVELLAEEPIGDQLLEPADIDLVAACV